METIWTTIEESAPILGLQLARDNRRILVPNFVLLTNALVLISEARAARRASAA